MTDCQDPEMEQGSNLPLPPGIDGEETNEPQVESELESPSTLAEKVLAEAQQALADSCDVSRGDYLFGGPDLDPEIENGHAGSEGEVDGRRIMDEIPAPSPGQLDTFNSLVTQATLSADVSDGLKLPWSREFSKLFLMTPHYGGSQKSLKSPSQHVDNIQNLKNLRLTIHIQSPEPKWQGHLGWCMAFMTERSASV